MIENIKLKSNNPPPILLRAIIFDCYGTLFDESSIFTNIFSYISDHTGIEMVKLEQSFNINRRVINQHLKHRFFMTQRDRYYLLFALIFANLQASFSAQEAVDKLMVEFASAKIFPETIEVIKQLREKYRVGLLANGDDEYILKLIEDNGLEFDAVVTSESMQTYKPNPLIFHAILSELGVEPYNAVMIGNDIENDIFGALNLGLKVIWLNKSKIRWEDQYPNIEMPISVQRLKDVLSLILKSFSILKLSQ